MAQHDYDIANQSFPSFRSDLNSVLEAINTSNSGTSRPTSAVAGTIWLDTTNATTPTLKLYDGTDDISLATFDYSANTVNWLDSTVSADLVNDLSPQLGGMLDVNGNAIGNGTEELIKFSETVSAVNEVTVTNSTTGNPPEISATGDDTNIDFKLTPKGTGKLILDGLNFPTSDGTADQVLKTDGAGNLSFGDAGGGGTQWQSSIKTSAFTAVAGEGYWINTTSGAVTVTLPASASVGDTIEFSDYARTWGINAVTINTNSLNFQGGTSPNPQYNTNGQSVRIVYSGATQGWIPTVDDDVTYETPTVAATVDFLVIAGGGSGGNADSAGGGGAGGYRNSYSTEPSGGGGSSESSANLYESSIYTITVGGGGSAPGTDGTDSSIIGAGVSITSIGGGTATADGGSGGGDNNNNVVGSGTANQGYGGGTGETPQNTAGGGGGAGEAGDTDGFAHGGDGLSSSITASAVTRAGGGGGCRDNEARPGGTGGGGNGRRKDAPATPAGNGTANTGSGGGGGSTGQGDNGGNGGSGIVIIRIPTADYTGTTSGSPTVTTSGTDTILTYTSSGTYTA